MSARLSLLLALLVLGVNPAGLSADAGAQAFAPKIYGLDRYQHIWKRSPFIVETAAVVQSPGLATKYGLVGIAWLNNLPVVFLWDKSEPSPDKSRFMVSRAKPDAIRGIELISTSMDKDLRKSSAVIKQGAEQASLLFEASSIPPSGPTAGQGVAPPVPMPTTGYVPPMSNSVINQPVFPPHPGQVNPATPPGQIPPPPVRRIIRPKPINVN
jgi:hypothetical protein